MFLGLMFISLKIQCYKHINDTHVHRRWAALAGNYHFHYFLPQIIRQTTQFLCIHLMIFILPLLNML